MKERRPGAEPGIMGGTRKHPQPPPHARGPGEPCAMGRRDVDSRIYRSYSTVL